MVDWDMKRHLGLYIICTCFWKSNCSKHWHIYLTWRNNTFPTSLWITWPLNDLPLKGAAILTAINISSPTDQTRPFEGSYFGSLLFNDYINKLQTNFGQVFWHLTTLWKILDMAENSICIHPTTFCLHWK